MTDIVRRLDRWLKDEHADDADQILVDARDEIISLRERLAESRDTLLLSMREMIEIGHADPKAAAKATLEQVKEQ
jgi:hypothetical protein